MIRYLTVMCVAALVIVQSAAAGTQILGLRVYANDDEYQPPIVTMTGRVTIEFDVDDAQPPDLRILFVHASRDWIPETRALLVDEFHSKSGMLEYERAPLGVNRYTFRYKNSFPDIRMNVSFPFSGNYLFWIVDHNDESSILAQGRFILVENLVTASMTVANKYYPEGSNPWNMRHSIRVNVSATPLAPSTRSQNSSIRSSAPDQQINHVNIKRVDIVQNWLLDLPYHIDVERRDPDTFVDNFYLPEKCFRIRSVMPGNEYRRLDIGSPRLYPNGQLVRLRSGYDAVRMYWPRSMDANGAAKLRPFSGANSEYLDVLFRLRVITPPEKDVFVVGAFNNWTAREEDQLEYDAGTKEYSGTETLRRGVYDYQYITGRWNQTSGAVDNQNWTELEGNDWRTITRYTALVYYFDERFGGLDRVVGMATAKSPGGIDETEEMEK